MTLGTVAVEAAEGSGARWTVCQALEQNRGVFCVLGSISSLAIRFTNRMIQEGAKLVSTCTDMPEELNISSINGVDFSAVKQQGEFALGTSERCLDDGSQESVLLGHIDHYRVHIDEIGRRAGLAITSVISMLTLLELKGMVKQVGCMHYVRLGAVGAVNGN